MRTRTGLLAAAMTAAIVAAGCVAQEDDPPAEDTSAAAEDWEPELVDGELQPLPDGFPDDDITLVNVDVAGSRDGIYARDLQRILEDISPVDITVSDEPATQGGTVYAMADVTTRPGGTEGYYPIISSMPGTSTDFLIEPIEDDLGLTLEDITFLISTEVHPYVIAQRADAPWGQSFEKFVEYGQENPGDLRYISHGVGSGQDLAMEWMLSELGIEVQKIPGEDSVQEVAAVAAGEGDFTMNRPDDISPVEQDGRIESIFFSSEEVPEAWADIPGVASAKDYEKFGLPDASWGVVLGFMLPAEVPDLHERWLYALFEAATETEQYQQRGETVPALQLQLLSTQEATDVAHDAYDFAGPIVREAGLGAEENE
ncbi:MAG: hypothetical protein GEU93_00680 [Propionibacteriales bacterium]|nr:hypothetical protein [Propionibacteriales bacterium]